jgi:hypothetical protein
VKGDGGRKASASLRWLPEERAVLDSFRHPSDVQDYLDRLDYAPGGGGYSPRIVLRERRAQCFSGALFAAAALRHLRHPPLLVDMRAWNDDDHVLAVFKSGRFWGAVGKSNFTTLRYREPVYRSLRELVMSYFDFYFNANGQKSLRSYSRPLDLRAFDGVPWSFAEHRLDEVEEKLEALPHYDLLSAAQVRALRPASPIVLQAGMLGTNPEGLFRPE